MFAVGRLRDKEKLEICQRCMLFKTTIVIITKIMIIGAVIDPIRPTIAQALNIEERHSVGHCSLFINLSFIEKCLSIFLVKIMNKANLLPGIHVDHVVCE